MLDWTEPGTGVAEPDIGGQKVLLIEQDRAVAESMVKVVPEKVTEQLGLLRVIGKSKSREIIRNILDELRDNVGLLNRRVTLIRRSGQGNQQRQEQRTTDKR